jgi:Gas vesicle protein
MSSAYDLGGIGGGRSIEPRRGADLADILERVLDKGVVIAGDIAINLLDIELLTIKLRLLVASADTARAMGIDWWTRDPFLTSTGRDLEAEKAELEERVRRLEETLRALPGGDRPAREPAPEPLTEPAPEPLADPAPEPAPEPAARTTVRVGSPNGHGR